VIYDTAIVGGGVIGLMTGIELLEAGQSVVIVDKSQVGRESSWAGAGLLAPLRPWRYAEPINVMGFWCQRVYADLAAELHATTGIDPEYDIPGVAVIDDDHHDDGVAWTSAHGVDATAVSADELLKLEPALDAAAVSRGIWMPHVASVRNPRLLQALTACFRQLGGAIIEGTEASFLVYDEQARLNGAAHVSCGSIVVAAGAWTSKVVGELAPQVEVRPIRGQIALLKGDPGAVQRLMVFGGTYVVPRRDGRVLIGSTTEDVGFDTSTTDEAIASLRASATSYLPVLGSMELETMWAGLRPGSPTGVPWIGQVPGVDNLYVNAGHHRNGLLLAPGSARLLADLMLGREPVMDAAAYSLKPETR
jgi:glycine oxidase